MAKKRSDAERRVRQCERLGRLLRLLHLIMGKGRWDADTLAAELECSRRTVYRLLQTLSMAGVPWYFDDATKSYRVRPGFRFTAFVNGEAEARDQCLPASVQTRLEKLAADAENLAQCIRDLLDARGKDDPRS